MINPPGTTSCRHRASRSDDVAADADVAVHQQHGAPTSLGRQRVLDARPQGQRALPHAGADRLGRDVDPQGRATGLGQRPDHPPRTASPGRAPVARSGPEDQSVDVVGRTRPPVDVDPQCRLAGGVHPQRRPGVRVVEHPVRRLGARRSMIRGSGARTPGAGYAYATAAASAGSSTSRSGGSSLTLQPRSTSRLSCAAPVRSVDIGMPAKHAVGVDAAQPDRPEPAVRRSDPAPRRRRPSRSSSTVGGQLRGVHARPADGARSARPGRSAKAPVNRSLRVPGRWSSTCRPAAAKPVAATAVRPVPDDDPAVEPAPAHAGHGVLDRRRGQVRRLVGGELAVQPGLHPARQRLLGQQPQRGRPVGHRSATEVSRTARQIPAGVPVTLDRPIRGRVRTRRPGRRAARPPRPAPPSPAG